MYDNFKILNYSNSLVSPELFARHRSKLFTGNVVNGLSVIPKTGLTVTLQTGNGSIPYGSGATASNREFSLVADFDITLDTADASNPRIDYIVVYVDTAVALPGGTPTTANLDGPGVVKATFVKGTPNASPVVPTVGAIQTKIGAANPYIIIAEVRVDALVTTIAANKITDKRTFAKVGTTNIDFGIWETWTPTWTNLTVGNGTLVVKYSKIGTTVNAHLTLVFGSTTSITGDPIFTLPVARAAYGGSANLQIIGHGLIYDTSAALALVVYCTTPSTTTSNFRLEKVDATYNTPAVITSTSPWTWAAGDELSATLTYEAA